MAQDEANERVHLAEAAKVAAEWERARAVERCAALDQGKAREQERAARAELAASGATDELVSLKREANLAKEEIVREKLEVKEKLMQSQDAFRRLEMQVGEERKGFADEIGKEKMKLQSVRGEVTRKVPELAAAALRQAEEEWKRRCELEVDRVRVERDQYVVEAQGALEGLRESVGG
jgi:hypothetical protein